VNLMRWRLEDFNDLYLCAVELPLPDVSDSFTVAFWFWAESAERRQVILQNGNQWEIAIERGELIFSTSSDDRLALPLAGQGWHYVRLSLSSGGLLRLTLDEAHTTAEGVKASIGRRLIVGGYTDPAGGHFDYTFGRGGSGLIDDLRVAASASFEPETPFRRGIHPPQAQFTAAPTGGDAPLDVRFDAGLSGRHYLWDFGDGQRGSGRVVTHRYEYAGDYKARLTVIDEHHGQSTADLRITVGGRQNPLRFVPVFVNGTEGYACYRIPSIVRALNGDLLAFAEARLEGCSDSTKTIHIVCKRSTDDGASWSPLRVVAAIEGFVCMNAAPVVDEVRGTGRIVVVFRAASHSEWDIARGVGISRAMCVTSDDHSATWSAPRDITDQIHKPYNPAYAALCPAAALPENQHEDWRIQIPSQGHAIQLRRKAATHGRLFFAGSLTRGERSIFESENYAFWSDDLGETWHIGGIIPRVGLNEAIAAELEDGGVLFNTRAYTDGKPDGRRAITRADFDESGAIHFHETVHDEALIDPAVQATLLRCIWRGKSCLLFANPAHPRARVNLTVRLSYDEGRTWAYSKTIDSGPSAYSDLVMTRDGQIGLLYERGNTGGLHFVRFTLDWLTDSLHRDQFIEPGGVQRAP
jgi:sialidase-1